MTLIDKPISMDQNIDYIIANNTKKSQETLLKLESQEHYQLYRHMFKELTKEIVILLIF